MLSGYMAYYFGIGKKGTGYRKAIVGGSAAALGIMAIYLVAGILLIALGALMFTRFNMMLFSSHSGP